MYGSILPSIQGAVDIKVKLMSAYDREAKCQQALASHPEMYAYEHIGGDLNDKITAEAQAALDEAADEVMADFRSEKRFSDSINWNFLVFWFVGC